MKTPCTLILLIFSIASFGQSNVRITAINPITHEVSLKNFGNVSQNISTHYLCYFPKYLQISTMGVLAGSTNLAAGASVTVVWPDGNGTDGECGYYLNSANFGAVANMRDYMEWGSAGHTRESVAVSGGYWCTNQFVANSPDYVFTGTGTDHCSAFWSFQIMGCTHVEACNYNPAADINDGSCQFSSCAGCTYSCAPNYNPAATIDDGSCSPCGSSSCPGDLDGNSIINTSDLLLFMAIYGSAC